MAEPTSKSTPEPKPRAARRKAPTRAAPGRSSPPAQVRLTGDRLVVQPSENGERRSRTGLLIPATAAQAPKRCVWAEVSLIGPDVRGVRTGDSILFLPQAGLEVEIDGEEYLLLRERDVQAVSSPPADDEHHTGPGQYL